MRKTYSWRSFTFLIVSVLTTLAMFLIDPIAMATTEQAGFFVIVFLIIMAVASNVLAFITFSRINERKGIAVIALSLTVLNTMIIAFLIYFGANFS